MNITKVPIIQIIKNGEIIEVNPLTSTNDIGVSSDTLKLNTSIVDKELSFGELYSSQFSVQLFNIDDNLEGCDIQLFLEENSVRTSKFKGVIDSSKRDNIGGYRDIIAYDWIYYNREYDISNWWNNFWVNTRTSATIQEIRQSLITYLGFTNDSKTYVNDSIVIPNNFNFYTDLKLNTILKMICELQAIFPHIDENGNMEFISITNTNTSDLTNLYEGNNSKWEDYTTELITGVGIYSTSNDLSQLIGTTDNVYNISGNLFALTLDAQTLNTLGNNILSAISNIQFTPSKIKMIVSNFDLKLGQRITTPKGYGYVMTNSLSGVCLIEQTIESKSMGSKLSQRVDSRNDTLIEGAKMSKFEQDIDGFTLEVQRIDNVATQASNDANTALNNSNRAIVTDTLHYLATSQESGVTTATSGWTTTTQSVTATDKYLWTYHTYTYADSHTSDTTPVISGVYGDKGAKGDKGEDGDDGTSVSITSTSVTYQTSTSGTTVPTGTWQSSVPTVSQGSYLWTRTIVNYSNNTSTTSYSVSYQGQNGANGTNGTSVTVSSIQYASSTSGTTAPSSGWQNTIPTVAQGSYLWTKTTYSNGSVAYTNSRQGVNGTNGTNGTSVTITSQSVTYQVGSSGTTAPTGTWKSTPQATSTGQFLWTRTIVNYSNGTSTTSYSVSAHGSTGSQGATGVGISEVTPLYYVSNSSTVPSAPSSQVTTTTTTSYNTWTKGIPALTTTYKYMYTCDQVKYTNNTFAWTTPVLDKALSTAVSEIKQMADQIVLKVDNNGNVVKVALSNNASTGSNVLIKGDNIQLDGNVTITSGFVLNAGVIQSQNYVANTSGTKINLTDGTIDTKNFKLSNTGVATMTEAVINGAITFRDSIKVYDTAKRTTSTLLSMSVTQASGGLPSEYELKFLYPGASTAYLTITSNSTPYFNGTCNYATGAGTAISANSANTIRDAGDNNSITAAYSKAGLNYGDSDWLAIWNGYELRAINKNNFIRTYTDSTFYRATNILTFISSNNALVGGGKGNYIWAISSWSDQRIKKNIHPSTINALSIINNIPIKAFDFVDKQYGSHQEIGYVAQDIINIVPEMVEKVPLINDEEKEKYGTEWLYQVEDKHLIKYLVKAIQELSVKVTSLENKLKTEE